MSEKSIQSKLSDLRAEMKNQGVDGFIIPRTDEWQNEYVPEACERLRWVSGFTGSAGNAIVTSNKAVIASDGRYDIQLNDQVDANIFQGREIIDKTKGYAVRLAEWVNDNDPDCKTVGYDPRLHTHNQLNALREAFDKHGIKLQAVKNNPLDLVWSDRPEMPQEKVVSFPEKYAGQSSENKRLKVADDIKENGAKALIVTETDAVAWLLNIRGNDVSHTPIALSYAVVHLDGSVDLIIDPSKLDSNVKTVLGNDVRVHDIADTKTALGAALSHIDLASHDDDSLLTIAMDFNTTPEFFNEFLTPTDFSPTHLDNPCVKYRACKNEFEKQAIIDTHKADGVALVKFLKWVDETVPNGTETELSVEEKLREFRSQNAAFKDDSFDTIAGWQGNGAIVHYRATEKTSKTIQGSGLLLIDSGGQYLGDDFAGTTDITRTVAIGTPTQEMKDMFTRVLKGHIAIAKTKFPKGTTGKELDKKARDALHEINQDYAHGTGHGVGCYLSVHESGTGLHRMAETEYEDGMFLSNEPGFYKKDEYGIRIENLIFVEEGEKNQATGQLMMRFNTVSLAPIDARLINPDLLTQSELDWLNDYHKTVYDVLTATGELTEDETRWLKSATAPGFGR